MISDNALREFLKTMDSLNGRFEFNPTPNDRVCINTLIKNKKKEIADFEAKIAKYEKYKTEYEDMKKGVDLNLNDLLTKVLQGNTEDLQWDNIYHANRIEYSENANPETVIAAKLSDTLRVRLRKNKEFALKNSAISSFFNENPSEKLEKLKHELEALEIVKQMLS